VTFTTKPAKRQVFRALRWRKAPPDTPLQVAIEAACFRDAPRVIISAVSRLTGRTEMTVAEQLDGVVDRVASAARRAGREPDSVQLVAVSKTFPADVIRSAIARGQRVFGENRVQEAQQKWPQLKAETGGIELHLIGPLQSNKAADAVALFDVIETVDREKIARVLSEGNETAGALTALLCPGKHRAGTAKSRSRTGRDRRIRPVL